MYSGSDSTESQKYPQWALNPSAYQNMANDEVDWAALAQQWIIMKEAGPPPIPGEGAVVLNNKQNKEMSMEGGEAPMDVENDKDDSPAWNVPNVSPQITPPVEPWNWNAQNQSWGWNSNWTPSSSAPPPAAMKPPLLPTPSNFNQFSTPPDSSNDNAVPFGSNNNSTTNPPANNDYTTGYWTSNSTKQIKPHNRRFSKVNVPRPVPPAAPIISDLPLASATPTLDAAKRKQLPAWIREGLEKMERDKLKQIEKEREKQERDEYNEKVKQNEKEKMEILRSTMKEQQKSKFESDNEGSDNDTQDRKRASSPEPVPLTHDELVVKVRRTMTQILLNVTNHHIENICKEEHDRYLKKYKASDQRASAPSGANISAKLGLGMYGGDTGSSSDDSHDGSQKDKADSDSELKDTIKRKALEFSKTEREIENKLAQAENRKAGNESRSSTPDTNDNDSQVDARPQGRKQRSIDRTPPHRHDYKKKRSMSSSSGESSSYLNTRSKHRRSSSSNSNDSRRKSKRRYSRSRTPEKKYKNRSIKNNSRRSRSKSPSRKKRSRSDSRSRRESTSSRSRNSRRSRSRSYSRSRRSRSSSFRRSKRSSSRDRVRDRSRSRTSSRYSKTRRSRSRSDSRRSSRRRRSRSNSSSRGKRSHRH